MAARKKKNMGLTVIGAGGAELLEELQASISPVDVAEKLAEIMNATLTDRLGNNLGPDYRLQLEAIKLYFAYTVGTPVPRLEAAPPAAGASDVEVLQKLLANPAACDALEKILRDRKVPAVVSTPTIEDEEDLV